MTDCIVVGGGLIGMLTARFLHQEGADVLVLERKRLGSESSWAGGGILSPLYPWRYPAAVSQLAKQSQRNYVQFARSLFEETGIDPECIKSGLLVLDIEDKAQAQTWCKEYDIPLEILGPSTLTECEPLVSNEFKEGLWMPSIGQIRNPRLVKALRTSLVKRGIKFFEQKKVLSLSVSQGVVTGVNTQNETITANKVLIASGAWSSQLIPPQYSPLNVEPVRGQMIVFNAKPGTLKRIVLYRGHYAIPRKDGRILVGSTIEYVGFDKQTSEEALGVLSDAAVEMIPSILDYRIEHHWSGLRPGTSSGIPYIGEHPQIEGLYFNCGHFRNGVVLGLSSARLAADLILSKTPSLSPEDYSINAPR